MSIVGDSPSTPCSTCGTIRKNHSSTITSGIERNTVTYAFANHASGFTPDSRSSASSVPQTIPTTIAISVILNVTIAPDHSVGSAPGILLQSN